jgi:hypothetical protein
LVFGIRRLFSRLAGRQDVKEHRYPVPGFALVLVCDFEELLDAEASIEERLDVGLERTVFPVEGHRQAVSCVRADTQFGFEVRPLDDKIVI